MLYSNDTLHYGQHVSQNLVRLPVMCCTQGQQGMLGLPWAADKQLAAALCSCRMSHVVCATQEAASAAAAEAQSRLQAAEDTARAAETAATDAAGAAAAKAKEEYDNLRRVLDAVNAQKADLEGKLARAGSALNAADELKEARCDFDCCRRAQRS